MRTYDVAIVGGGLAGNLLARQLRRQVPSASVVVIEKARERSYKVGESTVDVAGSYLTRRLGLSTYLYDQHLPKNGLRFFFDREDKSGALEELSENGGTGPVPFPTYQIDRARMEEDLLRMNAASGVDVRIGVRVARIDFGRPHTIALEEDGQGAGTLSARWVIDASGRSSVVARTKSLRTEVGPANAAAWGRFRGVIDMDESGSERFRARVRHSARVLSTNHFCYPGYWIWLIPLGRGVTSVGVVMQQDLFTPALRNRDGLLAFLRSHRAIGELMRDVETIDTMSFGQLAYGTKRFVDAHERWALIGEAAAFTDPLYSPGSDYIALENDWVTDLVRADLAGVESATLDTRARLYERALFSRLDSTLLLYDGLYGTLGSFELFSAKWLLDLACYFNLWVEPYLLDRHLDLGALSREIETQPQVLGVLRTFRHLFLDAERTLRARGRFLEKNLGHANLDPGRHLVKADVGTNASAKLALPRVRDVMQTVVDDVRTMLGQPRSAERIPFSTFTLGRPIV